MSNPWTYIDSEPDERPLPRCRWCDGQGEVEIASIWDADGQSKDIRFHGGAMTPCPRCLGDGVEPDNKEE